jgi:hypothetical protein
MASFCGKPRYDASAESARLAEPGALPGHQDWCRLLAKGAPSSRGSAPPRRRWRSDRLRLRSVAPLGTRSINPSGTPIRRRTAFPRSPWIKLGTRRPASSRWVSRAGAIRTTACRAASQPRRPQRTHLPSALCGLRMRCAGATLPAAGSSILRSPRPRPFLLSREVAAWSEPAMLLLPSPALLPRDAPPNPAPSRASRRDRAEFRRACSPGGGWPGRSRATRRPP